MRVVTMVLVPPLVVKFDACGTLCGVMQACLAGQQAVLFVLVRERVCVS